MACPLAEKAAGSIAARGANATAAKLLSIAVILFGAGLAISSDVARAQQGAVGEYQVKAAFLYNFGKFIEWPANAFGDSAAPVDICTSGDEAFPKILEQTVAGKSIRGRSLRVRRWRRGEDLSQCRILFIGASEKTPLSEVTEKLQGAATLTVGEREGFAENGGMINFVLIQEQVRFEINKRSARDAGLKINSKLLSLATEVWE